MLSFTNHLPVHFILNPGHIECELCENFLDPSGVWTMTRSLQVHSANHYTTQPSHLIRVNIGIYTSTGMHYSNKLTVLFQEIKSFFSFSDLKHSLFLLNEETKYIKKYSFVKANSILGENYSRQFEIFFLFFPEKRLWHFIHIVSLGDKLHKMSKPIFWEK